MLLPLQVLDVTSKFTCSAIRSLPRTLNFAKAKFEQWSNKLDQNRKIFLLCRLLWQLNLLMLQFFVLFSLKIKTIIDCIKVGTYCQRNNIEIGLFTRYFCVVFVSSIFFRWLKIELHNKEINFFLCMKKVVVFCLFDKERREFNWAFVNFSFFFRVHYICLEIIYDDGFFFSLFEGKLKTRN